MRQCAEQSTNREKAKECDLGLLPTQEPNLEHFLGEPAVMQGAEVGSNCLKSPLWRTTKAGWSGEAASLTCQTGGKSCWPSLRLTATADLPRRYRPLLRFPR